MDPLTHNVTALLLARTCLPAGKAGTNRRAPYATPTLIVAANLPDLDMLSYFFGGAGTYLEYHRAWTHSLLGAGLLGAGVALLFWRRARQSLGVGGQAPPQEPQANLLRNLLLAGVLGGWSHSVLDWTTAYGTQLLWPFHDTWYALDWFPIIDLWLLVILLLSLALPALFRLISEEIGARPGPRGRRRGAWLALAAYVLLAAGRGTLHDQAVTQLDARLYHGRTPRRVGAFPLPLNPFRWHGVVETDATYETVALNLLRSRDDREEAATLYKPAPSPTLDAAFATRTAEQFLRWARFPHATLTPSAQGWRVGMYDLRYALDARQARVFVVGIEVNQKAEVVEEQVRFARFGGEPPP